MPSPSPSPSPSPQPDPCEGYVLACPDPPNEGWPEYCCVEDPCGCSGSGEESPCECDEKELDPTKESIHNDCEDCEWSVCPAESPPGKPGFSSGGKGATNALSQGINAVQTLQRQLHQRENQGGGAHPVVSLVK